MSSNGRFKPGDFVLPGDKLGVIEEYIPGSGTFEKEGTIYANTSGTVKMDMKKREIEVKIENQADIQIRNNDIILGKIVSVKAKMAYVDIYQNQDRDFQIPFAGAIQIQNIVKQYVNSIDDEIVEDDWIRAKVIDEKAIPIQLTLSEFDLGVVHSLCRFCGFPLKKQGNYMKCTNDKCRKTSTRKTAKDYENPKFLDIPNIK
ncbi:MAG: exosome complex RNA-binding protein Csl4 [Candidatus Ranarchaeia archaeon]